MNKLEKACKIAIADCMGTKKDEPILIISDAKKRKIGYALQETALKLGYHSTYVEIPLLSRNGEEPPVAIAELMKNYGVVFCPTSTSLTHTDARRNASAGGVRIATFPGITEDVMIRGMNANYKKIAALTVKLKDILQTGSKITIITKAGTDLTFSIAGRQAYASKGLFHAPGESGNLPTGEAYLAPVEGTANGTLVVDGSMASVGTIGKKPIIIQIKDGYAEEISGGKEAKAFEKLVDSVGREGRNVAEFGIGTNPSAKISGVLLEDEKVMGTIHIAFGNNKSMGGTVGVSLHLDGVVMKPTVYMDDTLLLKNGKLLVK